MTEIPGRHTNGACESVLFWHIRHGQYGNIDLDDLSFGRVGRWEGYLWAGKVKGAAGIFIDERADERQADVLRHAHLSRFIGHDDRATPGGPGLERDASGRPLLMSSALIHRKGQQPDKTEVHIGQD